MKAILEFDLPDDRMEHLRCVKATDMALALFEIHYNLRKHVENELSDNLNPEEVLDIVFREIGEITEDINIDELIN